MPVMYIHRALGILAVVNALPNLERPVKARTRLSLFYERKVASNGRVNTPKRREGTEPDKCA
jgi:hypothetical protein